MEKKEVYYFTGTGNSYITAKKIAENTNCKLVNIAKIMQDSTMSTDAKILGFIFPVYYVELPIIVDRFISMLNIKSDAYIFAVATFGGGKGGTLKRIQQLLINKGCALSAFYGI